MHFYGGDVADGDEAEVDTAGGDGDEVDDHTFVSVLYL